jgi:ABC-type transport system substrate-binding protein
MQRIRSLGAVALGVAAVLTFTGCAGGGSGDSAESDTLSLGITADIGGWSTLGHPPYQSWPFEAVYEQLVQCDPDEGLIAEAAETWEIGPENRSFTAHLRDGAKFSDGSDLDAEAVKANFELVKEEAPDRYGGITYDIPDPLTITITWPDPQPLINDRACRVYLASPDYLASGDVDSHPVGSGPYTYNADDSSTGSVYLLDKNPDYWNADEYPFEHLEFRILEDETAALNAVKTGQIAGTVIPTASYDEAEAAGLNILKATAGTIQWQLTDHEGKKIPALGSLEVRQAINMVLDKKAIADQLFKGQATVADQIFDANSAAFIKDAGDPYPYDVDKAKQLMQDSGFGDGFSLTLPTMEGQQWTVLLPYVTQQLALLNITVEQKALTGPGAIDELLSGDFPAPLWTLGSSANSIEDISIQVLDTGYWNVMHEPDENITEWWNEILVGDEEEQAAAQQKIGQYVIDNAWYAPIVSPNAYYVYSDEVSVPKNTNPQGFHPLLIDFKKP